MLGKIMFPVTFRGRDLFFNPFKIIAEWIVWTGLFSGCDTDLGKGLLHSCRCILPPAGVLSSPHMDLTSPLSTWAALPLSVSSMPFWNLSPVCRISLFSHVSCYLKVCFKEYLCTQWVFMKCSAELSWIKLTLHGFTDSLFSALSCPSRNPPPSWPSPWGLLCIQLLGRPVVQEPSNKATAASPVQALPLRHHAHRVCSLLV